MDQRYLTVSALNKYIKLKLENDQHLKRILLKGEISNFKHHQSGHFYFAIKDDNSQINAMMFKTYTNNISFLPKDGDKVLIEGYLSLYEVRGTYSISVVTMTLDGIGELYLKYEKLKRYYEELGYFKEEIKKPIPKFPKAIGVITSKTGAVIEDIKTTVRRRYLQTKIILYPSAVQGESAKTDLVKQIQKANLDNLVDVLIIGRGGGSIEDLWGFNEAIVVEAIYQSKIPVITAIGHETDVTLSDFVGDLRAPTPTAAAELATPNTLDLLNDIKDKMKYLDYYINERFKNIRQTLLNLDERLLVSSPKNKLEVIKKNLVSEKNNLIRNYFNQLTNRKYYINVLNKSLISPKDKLNNFKTKLENTTKNLNNKYKNLLKLNSYYYKTLNEKLIILNPLSIMDRGFTLTYKEEKLIKSINEVNVNDNLDIKVKDGTILTKVLSKKENL